jgi:hypothetical protein
MIKLPFLLATLALPACSFASADDTGVPAAGSGDRRTFAVRDFSEVALAAVGDVEVRTGGDFSVTATGSSAALDQLRVTKDGDMLKLDRRRGVDWPRGEKVRFMVTMPRITGANIGGAGSITVDRVAGEAFQGNIGGSGRLDIRGLQVTTASFAIGGSGDVTASGRARALEVSIGGSGDVQVQPLVSETAEVTIAGAGRVNATATRTADVTVMGSGDVTIAGGAKCSITKMGGGNVRCG